jgi:predicted RND superfamily exporter protein
VVGLPVAAARGFELVSQGRYLTNIAGIVAAGLVLLVGLRRRSVAGRAVLAAALATGWGLAGSWLLGVDLSPLSVALGSLTTATACEFTVLLVYAGAAGARTLRRTVGVAALAASLGYLALVASKLSVIRDFGLLLAVTVGLSLLAAQLVVRVLPTAKRVAPALPEAVPVGAVAP